MAHFVPFIIDTAARSPIGVTIAYGIKLSIDHDCGGTVTFEAKLPELAEIGRASCRERV